MKPKTKTSIGFGVIGLFTFGVLVYAFLQSGSYAAEPTKPVTVAQLQSNTSQKVNKVALPDTGLGNSVSIFIVVFATAFAIAEFTQFQRYNKNIR